MQVSTLIPGFTAVAVACGAVLFSLGVWNQSGIGISVWLGFVATLLVGVGLAVLAVLLSFVPAAALVFAVAGRSVVASGILWVLVCVAVLFVANAVTEPSRVLNYEFFIPMGVLYGSVSGIAFWRFGNFSPA